MLKEIRSLKRKQTARSETLHRIHHGVAKLWLSFNICLTGIPKKKEIEKTNKRQYFNSY